MQTNLNLNSSLLEQLEQLIDSLQACFSLEEAYQTLEPLLQELFPNEAGAIYVMSSSKNLLDAIATWGPLPLTSDPVFTPKECVALRRQEAHLVEDTHHGLVCQHIRSNSLPVETLCVPMIAHGETIGVLHISSLHRGRLAQTKQLAMRVAKHIGLALANLRLRETLQRQSLRDPLTKLFNRRYLEECLEREIRRSERHPQSLGVILLEIDRFESFNETLGCTAGDFLLQELGAFLPSQIRASDIACRYRGEEFLLLLPETSLETARDRAEQLRQAVKSLALEYKGEALGAIAMSCGVASFPEHGLTAKAVIRAASAALDSAKENGCDRTVVCEEIVEEK